MTLAEFIDQMTPEEQAERAAYIASKLVGVRENHPEEEPILAELRAIGIDVDTVWSQFLQPDEDPRIYEILMRHLQRGGYDPKTMEGLAGKFQRPSSRKYWWELRDLYLRANEGIYRDTLAGALGASARRDHLEALFELMGRKELGDSRVMLMRRLKRIGGERALVLIESLRDDPELGVEAKELTKPKRRRT